MSTNAVTIIASTKVRIAAVLGASYSELAYSNDITKNSFKGNFKRYGLLSKEAVEISSVTRYVTLEQTFELILTDSYINQAMSDAQEIAKGPVLQDLAFDIYRDLINTKAGSASIVVSVNDSEYLAPETLVEDNVVVVRARFKIKFRNAI